MKFGTHINCFCVPKNYHVYGDFFGKPLNLLDPIFRQTHVSVSFSKDIL